MFNYLVNLVPHWILLALILIGAISCLIVATYFTSYYRMGTRFWIWTSYLLYYQRTVMFIRDPEDGSFEKAYEINVRHMSILGFAFICHRATYPQWVLSESVKRFNKFPLTWIFRGKKWYVVFQPVLLAQLLVQPLRLIQRWLEHREAKRRS